ncbi:hypothetical protein BN1708_019840, partial [Verticillium longisporum]
TGLRRQGRLQAPRRGPRRRLPQHSGGVVREPVLLVRPAGDGGHCARHCAGVDRRGHRAGRRVHVDRRRRARPAV